jgi:hypothetical protein
MYYDILKLLIKKNLIKTIVEVYFIFYIFNKNFCCLFSVPLLFIDIIDLK